MTEQELAALQTLPKRITDRILQFCYYPEPCGSVTKSYVDYQELCEYARAYRGLRRAALPYMRQRLIFERYNMTTQRLQRGPGLMYDELRAAQKQPPQVRWLSNMHMLSEPRDFDAVREVVISTQDRYPHADDVLDMLRQFELDQHPWPNVTTLSVCFTSQLLVAEAPEDSEWIPDESFAALAAFLQDTFPNVENLCAYDRRSQRTGARNALTSYIASNLDKLTRMHLGFECMPVFGVKTLPSHITHLHLNSENPHTYLDVPRIVAPTLVELHLRDIPLSYLWDRFSGLPGTPLARTVEFTRLERMYLSFFMPSRRVPAGKADDPSWEQLHGVDDGYADDGGVYDGISPRPRIKSVSVTERSPKYCVLRTDTKRPRFPRLRTLELMRYPGRLCEFFKDIPVEQLHSLTVTADLVAFKGLRLNGFTSLRSSKFNLYGEITRREIPHGRRYLARVLAQGSNVRKIELEMSERYRMYLPPADKIRCTGLRALNLSVPVSYLDLVPLLQRLVCLEYLSVMRVVHVKPPVQTRSVEGMAQHLLATGMKPISTSLIKFSPNVLCRDATDETVFYNTIVLISRIPSLRKLNTLSFYSGQFFRELWPLLKVPQLFPYIRHLASLESDY
ncbi:hypothetical protein H4S02_002151 [Coemansia sp. RSA 2611]|nr:hypothetical protein IWW54_001058 [Coemansia sp. RSA 2705]KAJ2321787.1 hypothetical protein IWW52_000525 [Coemansia sp. RSA 2704]KAJ2389886.1 hypothetical protein H4S02_002151 [Coemansia sp. RSA 2611]KAJ2737749.1 hypothetical protein H4R23_001629 [Coemansia sp. Cherry 401B]